MIKTIITPRNNSLNLVIPNNYIGQEKEVLLYAKDKLLEENRITLDDVKRKEILDKWQQIIYDDQAVTFLFSEKGRYLYSERFLNANFYEIPGSVNFTEWWIPKNLQK